LKTTTPLENHHIALSWRESWHAAVSRHLIENKQLLKIQTNVAFGCTLAPQHFIDMVVSLRGLREGSKIADREIHSSHSLRDLETVEVTKC